MAGCDIYDIPPRPTHPDGPPRLPSAKQRQYCMDIAWRVVKKINPDDPKAWLRGFCRQAIGKGVPLTAQDHNRLITALEHRAGKRDRERCGRLPAWAPES